MVSNPGQQERSLTSAIHTGSFHPVFNNWYGIHPYALPNSKDDNSGSFYTPSMSSDVMQAAKRDYGQKWQVDFWNRHNKKFAVVKPPKSQFKKKSGAKKRRDGRPNHRGAREYDDEDRDHDNSDNSYATDNESQRDENDYENSNREDTDDDTHSSSGSADGRDRQRAEGIETYPIFNIRSDPQEIRGSLRSVLVDIEDIRLDLQEATENRNSNDMRRSSASLFNARTHLTHCNQILRLQAAPVQRPRNSVLVPARRH